MASIHYLKRQAEIAWLEHKIGLTDSYNLKSIEEQVPDEYKVVSQQDSYHWGVIYLTNPINGSTSGFKCVILAKAKQFWWNSPDYICYIAEEWVSDDKGWNDSYSKWVSVEQTIVDAKAGRLVVESPLDINITPITGDGRLFREVFSE